MAKGGIVLKVEPTIYDIAKECGLSIATVSRVMNQSGSFSKKSQEKVDHAMQKLGYAPSKSARSLANKRTNTLALVFSHISANGLRENSEYTVEFLNGVIERAHKYEYSVLISSQATGQISENFFAQNAVDGLIITDLQDNDAVIENFIKRGQPVAYIGQQLDCDPIGCNIYGGFLQYKKEIFTHLYQKGIERVLVMHGDEDQSKHFTVWVDQAVTEFYEEHPDIDPAVYQLIVSHHVNRTTFFDTIGKALQSDTPPQAIVLDGSHFAMDLFYTLASQGLQVPQDISIVTVCHRRNFGESTEPRITTLYVNAREMGRRCVDFLLQQIDGSDQEICRNVAYELIERDSVKSF